MASCLTRLRQDRAGFGVYHQANTTTVGSDVKVEGRGSGVRDSGWAGHVNRAGRYPAASGNRGNLIFLQVKIHLAVRYDTHLVVIPLDLDVVVVYYLIHLQWP